MSRIWVIFVCLTALLARSDAVAKEPYAHPFGITPKFVTVSVDSPRALHTWQLHFESTKEFVDMFRQPSYQLLGSGKTNVVYYAVFRIQPDIYLYISAFVKEQKSNGTFAIRGQDGATSPLLDDSKDPKLAEVLEMIIKYSPPSGTPLNGGLISESITANYYGYAAKVKPHYHGPITFNAQNWNEGRDKVRASNSVTVSW